MIANPEKSQAILLNKRKSNLTNLRLNIDDKAVKLVSSTELLGIIMDDKLNFNLHIGNIWDKVFKNGPSKICGRQPLSFYSTVISYHLLNIVFFCVCSVASNLQIKLKFGKKWDSSILT